MCRLYHQQLCDFHFVSVCGRGGRGGGGGGTSSSAEVEEDHFGIDALLESWADFSFKADLFGAAFLMKYLEEQVRTTGAATFGFS